MKMRRCLKCRNDYDETKSECPKCGTPHNPGAEKLGYISFAIAIALFVIPDFLFYQENGRLPGSIDEFVGAFGLLF